MKSSRSATNPEQRLIVYVPQLESLLREAARLPPLIDALVTRCEAQPLDSESPQSELAIGRTLPAAALTRYLDCPDDARGSWLRADPIGLVPDLAAVWLHIDRRYEPGSWSEQLATLLDEEGLSLELTDQGRGYVRLQALPECRFAPPWMLAGSSLEYCLPEGPDARRWRRLLNETQVMLQQHRQRAENPESVPGSLWFWGAGALPDVDTITPRVNCIVADDPVLIGLAEWLGLPHRGFGEDVELRAGNLVEWPARFEDSAQANLAQLQRTLRKAWRRLRLGGLRELELAGLESVRRFTVADAWRVWR